MKQIFVPVDFSKNTLKTSKIALEFAAKRNANITLFHCYFDLIAAQSMNAIPLSDGMPYIEVDVEANKEIHDNVEKRIIKLKDDLVTYCNNKQLDTIKIDYILSSGNFILEIERTIDTLSPDLIIMSATGSGEKDSFSGSAASHLFNQTNVPILAIPDTSDIVNFDNILYATDFSESANSEIKYLLENFATYGSRIKCCHINFKTEELPNSKEMDTLRDEFKKEETDGKISFEIITEKSAKTGLEKAFDKENIELISFHSHRRPFFYSLFKKAVLKKNIYRYNLPILAFRKS